MLGLFETTHPLRIIAGALLILLGVLHTARTGAILREYKLVVMAHKRILKMAWVVQGLFYCFAGILVILSLLIYTEVNEVGLLVNRACAAGLFVLAFVITATGAQSEVVVVRAGPIVLIVAACLLLVP